jgi:hypothetical protein
LRQGKAQQRQYEQGANDEHEVTHFARVAWARTLFSRPNWGYANGGNLRHLRVGLPLRYGFTGALSPLWSKAPRYRKAASGLDGVPATKSSGDMPLHHCFSPQENDYGCNT